MMLLYRIFSYIIYGIVYPYGGIRAAAGDAAWRGRLALDKSIGAAEIWLHAASVGEVRVISYLIEFLKQRQPNLRMHLTVMTRAGYGTAKSLCGEFLTVSFLPLDVSRLQRRMMSVIRPKAVVIAETEIWPNLIQSISAHNVPIILVNGRITERALRRYLWFRRIFAVLLSRYDRCFVKNEEDRERFLRLGANPDHCEIAGDMKFDAPLLDRSDDRRQRIRESLGVGREQFLFVAGSTREGEEEQLIAVYRSVKAQNSHLRLVLAPRHLDRLSQVEQVAQSQGCSMRRCSAEGTPSTHEVILVDEMGRLNELYLAADLAFVGGTLAEIGGHNLLEPVWTGTPVLFGPSVSNVREAAEYIVRNNYGAQIDSAQELESALGKQMRNEKLFRVKTSDDLTHSPTAYVGDYILRKLNRV